MILIAAQSQRQQTQDPKVEQDNPKLWLFPEGHWTLLFSFNVSHIRSQGSTSSKFFSHVSVNSHWLGFSLFSSSLYSCSKLWVDISRWNKMQMGFLVILSGFSSSFEFYSHVLGKKWLSEASQQLWQSPPWCNAHFSSSFRADSCFCAGPFKVRLLFYVLVDYCIKFMLDDIARSRECFFLCKIRPQESPGMFTCFLIR